MRLLFLFLLTVIIANCGGSKETINPNNEAVQACSTSYGDSNVTGTITIVGTPVFNTDTFTIIRLDDTSLQDSNTTLIGQTCVSGIPPSPFNYSVSYNTQDIQTGNGYFVHVSTYQKGQNGDYILYYISTFQNSVITNGFSNIADINIYDIAIIN